MIELKDISLQLNGKLILDEVSLSIDKGQTHVILGPSGAGKSTILRVILGLLPIDNGQVIIDGREISSLPEKEALQARRQMAVVFQSNALFDSLTVSENTAYFLKDSGLLEKKEIDESVKTVLSFVNLDGTEGLYPDQLSGGMKKRLAVARALVTRPQIILFDEPTTGLDPINSKAVLNLIQRLKSIGTTSVIVTHIINDAIMLGDTLSIIENGKIIESGTIKKILQSQNGFVREFFYEVYQDSSLLNEIQARDE
ncbi:MAG: ATP-binding cassette domain-containing protein [Ignavibacteria bacterium]|jgi:phospholipid/cholesterol/gamma-HCH transport system ATP-binding protein|nr:ATP-binding cassette domain-containing protein [Ignavibacteria bacterium]MCU7501755.1 ATP-binding cassette domain-containing protein [Ignavibacteria bacterium]MCU7516838.1 ATP-binding cassette domain-containing protein [Ignavibacteria bacterium]